MTKDYQARQNVLRKMIQFMGEQMASRNWKKPNIESKKPEELEKTQEPEEAQDEDCPHCDGQGCRFCE